VANPSAPKRSKASKKHQFLKNWHINALICRFSSDQYFVGGLCHFLRAVRNVACRLNFERPNKLGTETEEKGCPRAETLDLWVTASEPFRRRASVFVFLCDEG